MNVTLSPEEFMEQYGAWAKTADDSTLMYALAAITQELVNRWPAEEAILACAMAAVEGAHTRQHPITLNPPTIFDTPAGG